MPTLCANGTLAGFGTMFLSRNVSFLGHFKIYNAYKLEPNYISHAVQAEIVINNS